jgi:hypothetical protein
MMSQCVGISIVADQSLVAWLRVKYFSRSVTTSLGPFLSLRLRTISRTLLTGRVFAGRRHAWPAFRVSVVAIKANAVQAEEFFPSSEWFVDDADMTSGSCACGG